jgi:hypothetical protein
MLLVTQGAPANSFGNQGDIAIDLVAQIFYGPKQPFSWPTETFNIATAISGAVAASIAGKLDFKGAIDASTNPNYSAASKGASYIISVAGKVGGASGKAVDAGDFVIATADNAGGTEASVGVSWSVIEHNLPTLGTAATKDVGTGSTNVAAGDAPAAAQAAAIAASAARVIPTSDPHVIGVLWNNAGTLTISAG